MNDFLTSIRNFVGKSNTFFHGHQGGGAEGAVCPGGPQCPWGLFN